LDKSFLFITVVTLFLAGCGQKSAIKNAVEAKTLASAYGDGEHVIRNLTFPLSDSALAFKTPLPGIGPIAGGILKFVGNVFAANTNMGKLQMSYTQPIPELPEELSSVRLKRFFFYMKPENKEKRFRNWWNVVILGKGHVTFDFLDKLAVRMQAVGIKDPDTYVPTLETKDYDKNEMKSLMEIFQPEYKPDVIDTEKADSLVLLRYYKKQKLTDTALSKYGQIHIMETVEPQKTKYFLRDHPKLQGYIKRILILDNSLLIELEKDPIAEEGFNAILSEEAQELEDLKVTYIDTCTPRSCLELKVPDINLVPITKKANGLKLDAVIHAGKVPESFKLKGFVEFEVKVKTPKGV
jgi:hypothetical protein